MSIAFFWFLIIVFFSFFLIKVADWTVHLLRRFSFRVSASPFVVSSILVAIGSCLPEIVVAVTSSLEGQPSLSVGNILGSSIANISFLLGFLVVFLGRVGVQDPFFRHDLKLVFFSLAVFLFLVIDGNLSRLDGLVLLLSYFFYIRVFISQSPRKEHISFGRHLFSPVFPYGYVLNFKLIEEIANIIIAFTGLLFSAWIVVKAAIALTSYLNISLFTTGFIFIAMSTVLPELAFSIRAVRDKETPMFLGGLLGSLIANITLVVGTVSFLSKTPISFPYNYLRMTIVFLLFSIFLDSLIRSSNRIERNKGFVLLVLYFIVVVFEFLWQ